VSDYAELARALGLASRVHFVEEYIPDHRIADYFNMASVVLITYRAGFVSQSGVLHIASNFDKPVLASSGPGPLLDSVRDHNLGVTVEPDSVEALVKGLRQILDGEIGILGWAAFRGRASWAANIDGLLMALRTRQ